MMGLESGDGSLSVYNRDRVIIVVAIIIITCVSWVYLFNLSGDMDSMSVVTCHAEYGALGIFRLDIDVCHVACNDDRHDGTNCVTYDSDVFNGQSTKEGTKPAVCGDCCFSFGLCFSLARFFHRSYS